MIQDNELQEKLNRLGQTLGRAPSIAEDVMREIERSTTLQHSTARRVRERLFKMNRISRIAAAILIVAAIAGAWLTMGNGGATVAWADVRDQILTAETMTWKVSVSGDEGITMESRLFYTEPGLIRVEATFLTGREDEITIMDFASADARILHLIPAQKRATITYLSEVPAEMRERYRNPVAELRKLLDGPGQPLGEKMLDGRQVTGFRVTQQGVNQGLEMDVWVDQATGQPVLIEGELAGPDGASYAVTDIAINVELDEGLFCLTPPEDYEVLTEDVSWGGDLTEEDLIEGLRLLAALNDDAFPVHLTRSKAISEEEATTRGLILGVKWPRLLMFIQAKGGDTWRYVGGGVKLGDSQAPVCWYRPKDSETYRVIYGDLRIEDVAEDDLPAKTD